MPRKKNVKLVEETEATTIEDQKESNSNNTATSAEPNRGEIIDVEWEDVKQIFEFKNQLADMEKYFANMCLHFEKEKANIISQITYGQNDLYMMAQQLQKTMNVDSELTYELKLPATAGQKGFFLRKDE